ncbi:hypothetical protein GCM10010400_39690 [Streptomyces aculeolatus]
MSGSVETPMTAVAPSPPEPPESSSASGFEQAAAPASTAAAAVTETAARMPRTDMPTPLLKADCYCEPFAIRTHDRCAAQ